MDHYKQLNKELIEEVQKMKQGIAEWQKLSQHWSEQYYEERERRVHWQEKCEKLVLALASNYQKTLKDLENDSDFENLLKKEVCDERKSNENEQKTVSVTMPRRSSLNVTTSPDSQRSMRRSIDALVDDRSNESIQETTLVENGLLGRILELAESQSSQYCESLSQDYANSLQEEESLEKSKTAAEDHTNEPSASVQPLSPESLPIAGYVVTKRGKARNDEKENDIQQMRNCSNNKPLTPKALFLNVNCSLGEETNFSQRTTVVGFGESVSALSFGMSELSINNFVEKPCSTPLHREASQMSPPNVTETSTSNRPRRTCTPLTLAEPGLGHKLRNEGPMLKAVPKKSKKGRKKK